MKIPPRPVDELRRLAEMVAAVPGVAGRLALGEARYAQGDLQRAAFVAATWDGRPALVKICANRHEAEWAQLLSG